MLLKKQIEGKKMYIKIASKKVVKQDIPTDICINYSYNMFTRDAGPCAYIFVISRVIVL